MNLEQAVAGYLGGQGARAIRRSKWREGLVLKPNDYAPDELSEIVDGESRHYPYRPNVVDLTAQDWELVR
jgi:hypothetical protein